MFDFEARLVFKARLVGYSRISVFGHCSRNFHATNASASQWEFSVEAVATMITCLPTQALAFLAVFVYATHATQAIAFECKPGLTSSHRSVFFSRLCPCNHKHRQEKKLKDLPPKCRQLGQQRETTARVYTAIESTNIRAEIK